MPTPPAVTTHLGEEHDAHEYVALHHGELNTQATETVLLIHGAFGDRSSWDLVTPHLSEYHLLVPDLPSHGIAHHVAPFSVGDSARLLRELIVQRAHGGIAKVVGHSLGAQVAMRLVSEYPEVVDGAVFVSGFSAPSSTPLSTYLPYGVWVSQRVEWLIPRPWLRKLMDGADLPRPNLNNCTLKLDREIFTPTDSKWPSTWPARTLIVVAGKGDIIPSQDNAEAGRQLAEIGQRSNPATVAVSHPEMRHPWNYQAPVLFAAAVSAWFHKGEILEGFVKLE